MIFNKYQGTGNHFIITDSRFTNDLNSNQIQALCNTQFGIGADGFIFINLNVNPIDIVFYNPDGSTSFCGNGSRSAIAYLRDQQLTTNTNKIFFNAFDGKHDALIDQDLITISINAPKTFEINEDEQFVIINTGAPHYVKIKPNLYQEDIISEGKLIRYHEQFKPIGINVNFIEYIDDILNVRTYEKGVEQETLSCGSGVVASALAWFLLNKKHKESENKYEYSLLTKGGQLKVTFNYKNDNFSNIFLTGPAKLVFKGEVDL